MIGYLNGAVLSLKPAHLLLDVNGVGYSVHISMNTYEYVANKDKVSLFIHTSVKENSIDLFGFSNESEKDMFEVLISVNGIGPKSALGILSGIQVSELQRAIKNGDVGRLTSLPGIGKKTAERLIVELKSKVDIVGGDEGSVSTTGPRAEAIMALTALGYLQKTAEKTVADILSVTPNISVEEIIKQALRKFN